MTTVRVEGLEEVARLIEQLPRQAKFAASIGINRTMDEAQTAIRGGLANKFSLKRPQFVQNTIYRKPREDWATKDHLAARVRVHDERNQLAKFEEGGPKQPTRGRKAIAIPVQVPRNAAGIVPTSRSPKALLASGKAYSRGGMLWLLTGRGKIKKRVLAYVFRASVPIAPDLQFVETGLRVIANRAVPNIVGAIEVEFARGLVSRSGPSSTGNAR